MSQQALVPNLKLGNESHSCKVGVFQVTASVSDSGAGEFRVLKRPSSVHHSPMQVGWTSKLHVLGTCLSGAVLKSGMLDVGHKLFSPLGEALGFYYPPSANYGLPCWAWISQQDCISAFPTCYVVCAVSFAQGEGVVLPVFRFSSEKIIP